jgi:hypothetical protein
MKVRLCLKQMEKLQTTDTEWRYTMDTLILSKIHEFYGQKHQSVNTMKNTACKSARLTYLTVFSDAMWPHGQKQ